MTISSTIRHFSGHRLFFAVVFSLIFIAAGNALAQTSKRNVLIDKKKADQPRLVVAGSVTCKTLFAGPLAKQFSKKNNILAKVYSGGSEVGISAVYNRNADLAIATRALTPEERARGLRDSVIAYDAIAVVVHKANPVQNLRLKDLQSILRGKTKSWKKFGWHDLPISLILPDTGSGMRKVFLEKTLQNKKMKMQPKEALSTYGCIAALRQDSLAITICSKTQTDYYHVKPVAVDGVIAADSTVFDHSYPLTVPITIVSLNEPMPGARLFVEWITRGPAGKLLADHFILPRDEKRYLAE